MVIHWRRDGGKGWELKAVINGIGAIATAVTLLVVGISKFVEGAWITILLIPALVLGFMRIRAHYWTVSRQLSLRGLPPSLKPFPPLRVSSLFPACTGDDGCHSLRSFHLKDVTAAYVELEPGAGERVRKEWECWWPDVSLVVLPSPYRSVVRPLLDFLDQTDREHNDGQLAAVVLPEFVPARWWQNIFHNQTAQLLKGALLYRRRQLGFQRIIIDVPYHLRQ